jgi:hypothetical protein
MRSRNRRKENSRCSNYRSYGALCDRHNGLAPHGAGEDRDLLPVA